MNDYKGFPTWEDNKKKGNTRLDDIISSLEGIKTIDNFWDLLKEHFYYRKDFVSIYFNEEADKEIEDDMFSFQQYITSVQLCKKGYVNKYMEEFLERMLEMRIEVGKGTNMQTLARLDFIIKDNHIHFYFIDHINEK